MAWSRGQTAYLTTVLATGAAHAGLAALCFARGTEWGPSFASLRQISSYYASSADILLASFGCIALLQLIGLASIVFPLFVHKHTRRLTLRYVTGGLFCMSCALALGRVIANPAGDDWFWGGAVVLFTAAAGEAFLCDALLGRVYCWAALAAAQKLGLEPDACGRASEQNNGRATTAAADQEAASKAKAKSKASMRRLLALSVPDIRYIACGFTFLTLAAVGNTLIPGYVGGVIDAITSSTSDGGAAMRTQMLLLIGASVGTAVFTGARGTMFTIALARLRVRLRDRLFRSLVMQEQGFFDGISSGELLSRLAADTTAVGDQISLNVNVFLRSLIQAVGSLIFMFSLSWRLTALAFCTLPPTVIISRVYGNFVHRMSKRAQKRLAECNKAAEEVLSSMSTVRAHGAEQAEADRHASICGDYYELNRVQASWYGVYACVTTALPALVTAVVLYAGAVLVREAHITSGTLVSFLLYQMSVASAIGSMGDIFSGLMTVSNQFSHFCHLHGLS